MKELPDIEQLQLLSHRQQVLYALKAAKLVEHLITVPEAKEAIATVERWLEGKATEEECIEAANASYAANSAAYAGNIDAYYAANSAAYVARAAYAASYVAARYAASYATYAAATNDPSIEQQLIDYYQYLLTMNERVWKILEE